EVGAAEERIGLSLEGHGRAGADAVIVAGPDGRGVGDEVEQAPEALPFETRVLLAVRAADLSHKQQIAGDEQLKRRFVDDEMIVTMPRPVHDAERKPANRQLLSIRERDR